MYDVKYNMVGFGREGCPEMEQGKLNVVTIDI